MSFFGVSHSVAFGVALQLLLDVFADSLARAGIRGRNSRRDRRCRKVVQHEFVQAGQMDLDPADTDLDSGKSCFCLTALRPTSCSSTRNQPLGNTLASMTPFTWSC